MRLDVRKADFEHAPRVLDPARANKRILLVNVEVRVIDPEVVPPVLVQV